MKKSSKLILSVCLAIGLVISFGGCAGQPTGQPAKTSTNLATLTEEAEALLGLTEAQLKAKFGSKLKPSGDDYTLPLWPTQSAMTSIDIADGIVKKVTMQFFQTSSSADSTVNNHKRMYGEPTASDENTWEWKDYKPGRVTGVALREQVAQDGSKIFVIFVVYQFI